MPRLHQSGTEVDMAQNFRFIGVNITNSLSWFTYISAAAKKAHKCLYFLRMLSKFGMSQITLTNSTDAHEKASYPNTSQLGMATALPRSIRNCREL